MNAHNEFIHSFLETGPLSALILLALVFTTYSSIPTRTDKTLLAKSAFAAAFTSLVIHNLTGFSSKILPVAIFLPICSAVLLRQYESHSKKLLTLSTFKNSIRFFFGFIVIAAIYLAWGIYDNQLAILKANTLSSSGKPQQALQIALSNQPPLYQSPIQQLLISEILTKLGKTHKAQLALDKALELNPTEAQYYILKAERFPQQSFTQKSNLYEKAIALDPAAEIYRLKFAIFLAEAGKPEKALEQIEIGLKFSPGFHQVYKNYLLLENLQKKLLNRKKESDSEK
jgi:tetratricopeptide (TPR) repeat protein